MPPFLDHGLNNYSRLPDASFLLARIMPQNNLTPSQCTDPSNDPSKKTVQASTVRKSFAIKDLRIGVTGFEPAASTSRTKRTTPSGPMKNQGKRKGQADRCTNGCTCDRCLGTLASDLKRQLSQDERRKLAVLLLQ